MTSPNLAAREKVTDRCSNHLALSLSHRKAWLSLRLCSLGSCGCLIKSSNFDSLLRWYFVLLHKMCFKGFDTSLILLRQLVRVLNKSHVLEVGKRSNTRIQKFDSHYVISSNIFNLLCDRCS